MVVVHSLRDFFLKDPCLITIGIFDGVHLGHRKIFEQMEKLGKDKKKVAICFNQTPETFFLKKNNKKLTSLESKLRLFEQTNIDILVLLDFTKKLASLSYIEFLKLLKTHLNFTHLILGKDTAFGYKKQGTEDKIKSLENILKFKSIYIPKLKKENTIISSSIIKDLINQGKFKKASKLLGYSYNGILKGLGP